MKVLIINGDCVSRNTSANLCHLAYISGLVELGFDVDLLCADSKGYKIDLSMKVPESVRCFTYNGMSFYEKLSIQKQKNADATVSASSGNEESSGSTSIARKIIRLAKDTILSLYGIHGVYAKFVKEAQKFKSDEDYDYILSISTPVTSHLIAHNLLKANHIRGKKWIQIWEDPWYSDAYGFNGKESIHKEERRLLSFAEKVCYVSPLTLENQKRLYPEAAHKMYWKPLPFYYKNDNETGRVFDKNRYGYFGDYAPAARDLKPFYQAAEKTGIEVNICGNPSNLFTSTDYIHIHPRLPLNELKTIEDRTNILIFLCNRKGGQIPGKIYQYSATKKTILFIVDGTEEEKKVLKEYFAPFNRYVFCENTVDDICRAICEIESNNLGEIKNVPVNEFNPAETIQKVLNG